MGMHPRTKEKTKQLAKFILEFIAAGALTSMAAGLSGNPRRASEALEALKEFGAARVRQAFARLKMQDMIEYDVADLESPLHVTKKGLQRLASYQLREIRGKRPKKWDYLWRVVIFDIPERKRYLREILRSKLYYLGFHQLQKSVYVIPFDCTKELEILSSTYRLKNYFVQCVTPSLGYCEKHARRFFITRGMTPENF